MCHMLRDKLQHRSVTMLIEPASYRCSICELVLMGDLLELSNHVSGEHGGSSFALEKLALE